MLVYADQNFLIDCANNPDWRRMVIRAREEYRATVVLSPWSIYEIGSIAAERMNELIKIADEFRPAWILERADLEFREGIHAWQRFWGYPAIEFKPVGTLAEVSSHILRCNPRQLVDFTIRDYANLWQGPKRNIELQAALKKIQYASDANRILYGENKLTGTTQVELSMRYMARLLAQLARLNEITSSNSDIHRQTNEILADQRISTFLRFFVDFGGMEEMKAYKVESLLTFQNWQTNAILNDNRQIDRQHAVAALPYCDGFVTSDKELIRKCEAIRPRLNFPIATVQTGVDFIGFLAGGS